MKSTIPTRSLANPRRTTLAHLQDTEGLQNEALAEASSEEFPARTANPKRTVLTDAPAG